MAPRRIFRRRRANDDISAAITFYTKNAGVSVARDFIDELEAAVMRIAKTPTIGSLRYAHSMDLPGLRCSSLKRFPYLVFYMEKEGRIEVARVLHERMEIGEQLSDEQV